MGFRDWLTGKPDAVQVSDRIWLSPEAKVHGLCRAARDEAADADAVLVVAHFAETLTRAKHECEQAGLAVETPGRRPSPAEFLRPMSQGTEGRAVAALAGELAPDEFPGPAADELSQLPILVAERHFTARTTTRWSRSPAASAGRAGSNCTRPSRIRSCGCWRGSVRCRRL